MARSSAVELTLPVDSDRDHIQGPVDAPVTLVEYGDYECPYCGQAYPIVKEVQEELGDDLRFVFRNFPLGDMHPHARRAAEAAEAAATQGEEAFWEMHDYLYEHQDALDDDHLVEYADEVGLDVEQFEGELAERTNEERVQEDFLSGARSGVNGTPTFFIDGERYDGEWSAERLTTALRERL
ncbi:disulfide bond formation protein DsbA [Halobacteriales archaeon QH_6_64_20]|jgi:protein-disulfide isomerase|nr:MAG: disulfide bond formation protein DsbA [Halobacteriales archaeon QH_6_64_20]